ncbi:MAG TPA: hypothetical protein VIG33_05535 [Pseudobdellovibrionaceae bacterium]
MKNKTFISISFFCNFAYATSEKFIYEKMERDQKRNYFAIQETRISDTEECRKKTCLAYEISVGKIKVPAEIEWIPGGVNPTSTLCKKMEGTPKIGYMENRNEVSLCYFNDHIFIFGWDLMKISRKSNR